MRIEIPKGHTASSIARTCGVHSASVHRALADYDEATGVHVCSGALAIAIHYATKGAIKCWDLRPDYWKRGQIPPKPLVHDGPPVGLAA